MPEQSVHIDIGVNGAFLTRRWEEPENWMRLTREIGYPYHEFCADVLDSFFSGDREYQLETAAAVQEAAARYGVTITDIYTGVATHRFHGLSHGRPAVRERMRRWIVECMDLALAMGTDKVGGHWDAFSVETLADPDRTERAWGTVIEQFRELARVGRSKGIAAIYNEQMYIPSEVPWTLDQADRFLGEANDGDGCPVLLTVDTGHQAAMHYGLSGPDLDYEEWLRRYAAFAEIVHIQQTTPDASHHWPFIPEYNARGHVSIERTLEAIAESHRRHREGTALSRALPLAKQTILVAEIIPGSTKTEQALLSELEQTAAYLRQFIPEGGLELRTAHSA